MLKAFLKATLTYSWGLWIFFIWELFNYSPHFFHIDRTQNDWMDWAPSLCGIYLMRRGNASLLTCDICKNLIKHVSDASIVANQPANNFQFDLIFVLFGLLIMLQADL